jgi:hypothetical protein
MASASEEDHLQCGLCLDKFTNPKLLPCYHTFCEECLENLVKSATENALRCPKCRKDFTLPTGEAAALQTNFYITPQLKHGTCNRHPAKPLEYFCTKCTTPLCLKCKLTSHEGHLTDDLDDVAKQARTELLGHQARFEEAERTLNDKLEDLYTQIVTNDERRDKVKQQVMDRTELMRKKLLDHCKEELLEKVDESVDGLDSPLFENITYIEDGLKTIQGLKQEVQEVLKDPSSPNMLALARRMACGHGSQEQLQNLIPQMTDDNSHVVLSWEDDALPCDIIAKLLGKVFMFQPLPMNTPVTVKNEFQCPGDKDWYVHAIYCGRFTLRKKVYVALGTYGDKGAGLLYRVNTTGTVEFEQSISGRVSVGGLFRSEIRVEGKDFKAKDSDGNDFLTAGNSATKRKYDVYNKGEISFVIRVHTSGA